MPEKRGTLWGFTGAEAAFAHGMNGGGVLRKEPAVAQGLPLYTFPRRKDTARAGKMPGPLCVWDDNHPWNVTRHA
jgi:hypothetical protein